MSLILHANAVSWQRRALLIVGRSGSGKSSLSLALHAYGCQLIADDRTQLERKEGALWASCPPALSGLIEARGLGILRLPAGAPQPLCAVLDLDQTETERLPPARERSFLGVALPALHNTHSPYFPAAIFAYLRGEPADV